MDPSLILPYLWVLVVLVFLEGLLAADNAVVMAVMVKHLPPEQRKKALFYGLLGAFVFRFMALFLISIIANFWFIQAAGALYLLYMSSKNLYEFFKHKDKEEQESGDDHHYGEDGEEIKAGPKAFWGTVFKVEFADIAFANACSVGNCNDDSESWHTFRWYGFRSICCYVLRWHDWCHYYAFRCNLVC
jgi:YkoY family integral membrane protein